MEKIKILVIPSDTCGCGYYRSLKPHTKLAEMYENDFDIDIKYQVDWSDVETMKKYDIIHIHKGLFVDMDTFRSTLKTCRDNGTVVVMDLDDYWDLGPFHPGSADAKRYGIDKLIKDNIKLVDYMTTTTDIFKKEIEKLHPNVKVFVNAIDREEEQFISKPNPSDRIRFGFVMGSSHLHDIEMLKGIANKLPKDVLDKMQFVLCGYDLRGTVSFIGQNGQVQTRPMMPKESVWYEYEKILTDNYKVVSPQYKEWLNRFIPNAKYEFEDNEPYKRRWTKGIMSYCTHYNDIDVLLAPLDDNKFNSFKSELKLIEAGMMNKAAVVSDFGPYQLGTINYFEKGGNINPDGNCILIDKMKAHKDWAKTIEKLVKNPEHIERLRTNLHNFVKDKYDLANVTHERAAWYKEITKRG
jgi:glycosyltransferase involved in cell wall biosynthesis